MAWVRQQAAGANASSATSVGVAFPGAVTPGNLLVVFWLGHGATPTCSDSVNGAYRATPLRANISGSSKVQGMFYLLATGAGTPTVTLSNGSTGTQFIQIAEYAWDATQGDYDSAADGSGTGGASPVALTSGAPNNAGELAVVAGGVNSESGTTWTPAAPYGLVLDAASKIAGQLAGGMTLLAAENLSAGAGAESPSVPFAPTANGWGATIALITQQAKAAPAAIPRRMPLGV